MKKILAMLLVLTMALSLAACAEDKPEETTTAPADINLPADALEILTTVWNAMPEESKFMAMGGSTAAPVNGAPGAVEATDNDTLVHALKVPETVVGNIDGAASLMNGMMANNFTGGAFHVTSDAAAFATALRDGIQSTQWMCGFPEQLVVYTIGNEYVVFAFGLGDFITPFHTQMIASYPDAVVAYNEAVVG